jgi:hypothetical protein
MSKDAGGLITWGSGDTNLEKFKIQLLFTVVPSMLQYTLNRGSSKQSGGAYSVVASKVEVRAHMPMAILYCVNKNMLQHKLC